MNKEPLWSPDKDGEYHLGDLMYNLQKSKERRGEMNKDTKDNLDFLEVVATSIIFYAAGVQFRGNWRENVASLKEDQQLYLVPEPLNEHDKNAIQLQTSNATFLGYVPAKKGNEKNLWVKERLLEGKRLQATVVSADPDANPWQALRVEVKPLEA